MSRSLCTQLFDLPKLFYKLCEMFCLSLHVLCPEGKNFFPFRRYIIDPFCRTVPLGLPFGNDQSLFLQLTQVPIDHARGRLTHHKSEPLDPLNELISVRRVQVKFQQDGRLDIALLFPVSAPG